MATDPLITTVLDLDSALGGNADLLLGGGLGLLLKQRHLAQAEAKTLLPPSRWPQARTTQDIDLFLRAEVVANADRMAQLQDALNDLGFHPQEDAKWLKFTRRVAGQEVIVDLMVGPLGTYADAVDRRNVRVKPKGSSGLHARATDDALGVEHQPLRIAIDGITSDSNVHHCEVLVPQAFSFALMKLGAFRDRMNDEDRDVGRHHALDLYRIVAMLTEDEDATGAHLADQFRGDSVINDAMEIIDEHFAPTQGIGRIRMREHPLWPTDADPDWLVEEMRRLITPRAQR